MATAKEEIRKYINVLVLGETGVGKSTFINAFVNYMSFNSLKEAEAAEKINCLIPCKFTVIDDNHKEHVVSFGDDKNENVGVGESATQGTKSYMFPIGFGNTFVRIIDTPGIGDTRGIEKDNENFENILSYLGQYDELHGICVLLKPNNARLTVLFEFCIKQLLSRLEKSASDNILFVFTNSRNTFYRPGDTFPALRTILEEIKSKPPHCEIPLNKDNVFCLDNEAFRFLVSIKNQVFFTNKEKKDFAGSWEQSSKACWKLISYISGDASRSPLKPHKIKDTVSINQARRLIIQLSQPLAEIAQLIIDNLSVLKRHKQSLKHNTDTIEELKKKLYMPIVNLKVVEFPQPRTVCTATNCCTVYQVEQKKKWHYSQRCHNPCYLQNVPKEIVGSPELVNCAAIDPTTKKCRECSCDFSIHMHIYYETEVVSDRVVDKNATSQITDRESAMKELKNQIEKMNNRRDEYEKEKEFIIKTTAKFAHFLQNNAITPYNDAYQAYIEYLIDRECSMGPDADKEMISHLQSLLKLYDEEKNTLNQAFVLSKNSQCSAGVSADDIINSVQSLYKLKHTGRKIEELFNKQSSARLYENDKNTEYVHPYAFHKPNQENDNKSKGGKKNRSKRGKSSTRMLRSDSLSSLTDGTDGYKTDVSQKSGHINKNKPLADCKGNDCKKINSNDSSNLLKTENYAPKKQQNITQGNSNYQPRGPRNNFPRGRGYGFQSRGSQNNFAQGPRNDYTQGPHNNYSQRFNNYPQGPHNNYPQGPQNNYPQGPFNNYSQGPQNNYLPGNQNFYPQGPAQTNYSQKTPKTQNNYPYNLQNEYPQNNSPQGLQNIPSLFQNSYPNNPNLSAPTQNLPNQKGDEISRIKKMVKILNIALDETPSVNSPNAVGVPNQTAFNVNPNSGNSPSCDNFNSNAYNYQSSNWQNQEFPFGQNNLANQPQPANIDYRDINFPQNQFQRHDPNQQQNAPNFANRNRIGEGYGRNFKRYQGPRGNSNFKKFDNRRKQQFKPSHGRPNRCNVQNTDDSDVDKVAEKKEKSLQDEIADLFSSSSSDSSSNCSFGDEAFEENVDKQLKKAINEVKKENTAENVRKAGYFEKLKKFLQNN